MISLLLSLPLFLGWMTDQMIYEQEAAKEDANVPAAPSPEENKLPTPETRQRNRRAGLANEPGTSDRTTTIKTDEANTQGLYFVSLLDQGQWGASWLAAGGLLKDLIARNQWIAAMEGTRAKLGSAKSRKHLKTQSVKTLQGGTAGHFRRVTYQTQFSKGGNATETLILMQHGAHGQWKVVSYQVNR